MPGVYISYPFCAQKCSYCNFSSGVFPSALEQEYLRALEEEIDRHHWQWRPETVYIGGGSPSRIAVDALAPLLARIPGAPWREVTLEAAPGEITPERAAAWRAAGITRVSLGVQSFRKQELSRTGRRHCAETVAQDIAILRAAGLTNLNIDLIAGLPFQTPAGFAESLDWVERLAPPHVSVYILEVDEHSRLGAELLAGGERYGAAMVPSDEAIVAMYTTATERLEQLGLARYEISNFARPGFESIHNLKYWKLEPYVGFGADAHSCDGRIRTRNAETPADYVERWRLGLPLCIESTAAQPERERFWVGLRLSRGVRLEPQDLMRHRRLIDRLVSDGLLETDGAWMRLTMRGVLYSNEVFQEFL